jgi:hypothetical protein
MALLNQVKGKLNLKLPTEIILSENDRKEDVLKAHFKPKYEAIDSEIIKEDDNVILGLEAKKKVVKITILLQKSLPTHVCNVDILQYLIIG